MHKLAQCALPALMFLVAGNAGARTLHPVFSLANFSTPLTIDNPFLSMVPGRHVVYAEFEGDQCNINDVVVTSDAKTDFQGIYAGLSARAVSDKVWLDRDCAGHRDLLLEDTTDWFAQDNGGNVWYFGEQTVAYEYDANGNQTGSSTEGSWEAGTTGTAGLIMLAHPRAGLAYPQEFSAGVAEDAARVRKVGVEVSIGLGTFSGCVITRETTALTPGDVEYKYYCPNVGLVLVLAAGNKGSAEAIDLGL